MRTKFPNKDILPNILSPGCKLISPSGRIVTIQGTGNRDKYDQPTYRLKYPKSKVERKTRKGMEGGKAYWIMPASVGSELYSRDALQVMGMCLLTEEKKKETAQ